MITKSTISVNGMLLSPSREGFLSDPSVSLSKHERSLDARVSYGVDLMMFSSGDLFINESNMFISKDLMRVGGLLNLAQAVTHRLATDRGTHPEDRFFGVPWRNYLGQAYSSRSSVSSSLVADITEEIYKDRRVKEVVSVSVNFQSPTVISVECSILPLRFDGDLVNISVLVEDAQ